MPLVKQVCNIRCGVSACTHPTLFTASFVMQVLVIPSLALCAVLKIEQHSSRSILEIRLNLGIFLHIGLDIFLAYIEHIPLCKWVNRHNGFSLVIKRCFHFRGNISIVKACKSLIVYLCNFLAQPFLLLSCRSISSVKVCPLCLKFLVRDYFLCVVTEQGFGFLIKRIKILLNSVKLCI